MGPMLNDLTITVQGYSRRGMSRPAEKCQAFAILANNLQRGPSNRRHPPQPFRIPMSVTSRKTRPFLLAGTLAFAACVWPTLYSPLGVDRAGNPMRENRFTGAEE